MNGCPVGDSENSSGQSGLFAKRHMVAAIQEQFYLFVPFLVYFLPRRTLVCVLMLTILSAPLLRCASPGFHAVVNIPWRSDSLLSGVLLAVLVRWHPFVAAIRQHRSFLFALFVALLLGAAVMTLRPAPFGAFSQLLAVGLVFDVRSDCLCWRRTLLGTHTWIFSVGLVRTALIWYLPVSPTG